MENPLEQLLTKLPTSTLAQLLNAAKVNADAEKDKKPDLVKRALSRITTAGIDHLISQLSPQDLRDSLSALDKGDATDKKAALKQELEADLSGSLQKLSKSTLKAYCVVLQFEIDSDSVIEIVEDIIEEILVIGSRHFLIPMTASKLADMCTELGLSNSGKKEVLIDRILDCAFPGLIEDTVAQEDQPKTEQTKPEGKKAAEKTESKKEKSTKGKTKDKTEDEKPAKKAESKTTKSTTKKASTSKDTKKTTTKKSEPKKAPRTAKSKKTKKEPEESESESEEETKPKTKSKAKAKAKEAPAKKTTTRKRKRDESESEEESEEEPPVKRLTTAEIKKMRKPLTKSAGHDMESLQNHYWTEELKDFCRANEIKTSGSKKDLMKRILAFWAGELEAGGYKTNKRKRKGAKKGSKSSKKAKKGDESADAEGTEDKGSDEEAATEKKRGRQPKAKAADKGSKEEESADEAKEASS